MNVYSVTFLVMAILAGISFVLYRLREGEPLLPKPDDIEDVRDVVGFFVGFTSIIVMLAAIGNSDPGFYVYVRVAVTFTMLASIYYLLRYRLVPSLLLIGLIATLVLFNPFALVVMKRSSWIIADLLVAAGLPILTHIFVTHHRVRELRNINKNR
jgi:membrane protein